MGEKEGFLDKAYGLDDPAKARAFYRQWAQTYDDEVRANGYASPARIAAAMAANVADKTVPLLDLGCGTGLFRTGQNRASSWIPIRLIGASWRADCHR